MNSWRKLAQRTRVPVGTVLGILFLIILVMRPPSIRSLWIGCTIALAGAFLRLWAAGHIEKGKVLTKGGPYAFTRNPLYLGSFIMALGIIIAGHGYWWLLLVFGVFFVVFYFPVMKAEEEELLQSHGDHFLEYSGEVPFFIPGFRKLDMSASSFSWSRVIRNREHRTLAGLVLAVALLIILKLLR
jgi:protein-S-isoprenylcysteine O-methyltransferase Ste14